MNLFVVGCKVAFEGKAFVADITHFTLGIFMNTKLVTLAVAWCEESLFALVALVPLLPLVNLQNVSVEYALLREGTVAPVTCELRRLVN